MENYIFVIAHAWYVISSPKTLNNATSGAQRGARASRKNRQFEDYSPVCDLNERLIGF